MKTLGTLFVAGLAGIVALKVTAALLLPLLGIALGLLALALKVIVVAAVAWLVWSVLRRRGRAGAAS